VVIVGFCADNKSFWVKKAWEAIVSAKLALMDARALVFNLPQRRDGLPEAQTFHSDNPSRDVFPNRFMPKASQARSGPPQSNDLAQIINVTYTNTL